MPKKILEKDPIRSKLILMYASANDIGIVLISQYMKNPQILLMM